MCTNTQEPPGFIYLTFDDGPNNGTDSVLDALQAEGVQATFFINSINLFHPKPESTRRNVQRFEFKT